MMIDQWDTYSDIYNVYATDNGITPEFPFVVGSDATSLFNLFSGYSGGNETNFGGVSWVLSPNRSYVEVSDEATDIQAALDARPAIPIKATSVAYRTTSVSILSTAGSMLSFAVPQSGKYDLSLLNANGKLVGMKQVNCIAGRNSVDMGRIAQGAYIVKVSGFAGTASRTCILGNR